MYVTRAATSPESEASTQVVETSVSGTQNSPQNHTYPDERTSLNYDVTTGFKPFTI